MKSQVNAVWIAGAGVLAVIGVLSFSLAYQVQSVVRGVHERNIIEALNEMEFVKKAVPQAAIYSSYQAAYETLKYGGLFSQGCNPEKLNDIPYWKTHETSCEPNDIRTPLESKITAIFGEYASDIQENLDKISIKLPSYRIILTVNENDVQVSGITDEKLVFESKQEKFSDTLIISEKIKLPVKRLVDFGIDEFVKKDPFTPKITAAKDAMSSILLNQNLNGGKLTGNCKTSKFEICVHPSLTYTLPPKADLNSNCENEFKTKVIDNVNSLNSNPAYHTQTIDASVETNVNLVETEVDTTDETTCNPMQETNSLSCACIKWACTGSTPVVIGTTESTLQLPSEIEVSATQQCAPCVSISGSTCVQFTNKVCPSGAQHRDVNGNGILESNECVQVTNKACPSDHPHEFEGNCYKVETCGDNEKCSPASGCVSDPGNKAHDVCWFDAVTKVCLQGTPNGNECWGSAQNEVCPSSALFEFSGRCYRTPQSSVCILHETQYTKTCNYNYQADATSLVKAKDKGNSYPVHDRMEQETNFRNLELQVYVLSGDKLTK